MKTYKQIKKCWLNSSIYSYLKKWNKDDELAMEALDKSIPDFFLQAMKEREEIMAEMKRKFLRKADEASFGLDKGATIEEIERPNCRVLIEYDNDWHTLAGFILKLFSSEQSHE